MGLFDSLGERLNHIFSKLTKHGKLTELEIKQAMREVRIALLEADVNFMVAKDFINKVSEKAVGEEILNSLTPGQQVIKIVRDELTNLMGETNAKLEVSSNPPTIIMMCGLQGAGKTTMCGKLGFMLKKQGKKPLLAACDIYRPAAIEQLRIGAKNAGVDFFEKGTSNAVKIAKEAIAQAKKMGNDTVIIDTAGRLHNRIDLMNELTKIRNVMRKVVPDAPHEVLLVLDGSTGQNAFQQAKEFMRATDITALAVTKLDGTAKGGVVVGIVDQFRIPIKFVGIGEGIDDLKVFNKREFVGSLFSKDDIS